MTMEGYCFPTAAMAVVAVSGGVVLVAFQAHKRLLSGFLEKFKSELYGYNKDLVKKKKVRFAKDVMEPSRNNKKYRRKRVISKMNGHDDDHDHRDDESTTYNRQSMMPKNRMVLYKGILDYKVQVKGRNQYHVV